MSHTVAAVLNTIATAMIAEKNRGWVGIVRQTQWRRGLVMKMPSVDAYGTSSVNIAGVDREGYRRSDERIKEDVKDRLADDYYSRRI
jgi:osmotically-inducible protein OsmY